ncbi:unnamed protein product, partial [Mesorhabditis belari]|uniref:Glycosyltransferase 2-like domain-containing protein n=1 Tax=Mesorhabditis belari TaxID=2138241 RepID=A0AAF3EV12_9BILA
MESTLFSCIVPVRNGMPFLDVCLESLLSQDFPSTSYEVSLYDDGSTDDTPERICFWEKRFNEKKIRFVSVSGAKSGGVGFAKNAAVRQSSGRFLCFCDADDVSNRQRLQRLHEKIEKNDNKTADRLFLGSCFTRIPADSTSRFARWANSLKNEDLSVQIYTSHGSTLIAPTWCVSRAIFDRIGGFNDEHAKGFPEDLDFFYRALDFGVKLVKIDEPLVEYRYHPDCATFGVFEETIWNLRIQRLQTRFLDNLANFSIWSVGKQGKRFFKSLSTKNKSKVAAFYDVDERKVQHGKYEEYDEINRRVVATIPVMHIKEATPPIIICVKLDLTGGDLENFIAEKHWIEGVDYVHFS